MTTTTPDTLDLHDRHGRTRVRTIGRTTIVFHGRYATWHWTSDSYGAALALHLAASDAMERRKEDTERN